MSAPTSVDESFRRLPQQARSRQRVNQILDAAAQVFEEFGYEATSTELIATRANTSIGSLYRFFPDKSAILYALAEKYGDKMRDLFAANFNADTVHLPLHTLLSSTVDAFDNFYTTQIGCRVVMQQSRVSADLQAVNKRVDSDIVNQLDTFFALRQPKMDANKRLLSAVISVEIANALQLLSLGQTNELRQQILTETKHVLLCYLQQLFPDT
jgi:AcrR family transcriptional regulator